MMGIAAAAAMAIVAAASLIDLLPQFGFRSGVARVVAVGASSGESASPVLTVDSGPTEPAVPLDMFLKVRTFADETIEIAVTVGKRSGYPAQKFSDEVTAEIKLPAGLQLEAGTLRWAGQLAGDQKGQFVARIKAHGEIDGSVEAKAVGHADSGRLDAEIESFHVSTQGGALRVALETFPGSAPPIASDGVPVN